MTFEYSAFDINEIICELEKRNVSVSFEKVEQLYQAFDDIFPILLNAKSRSRKFFTPLINIECYDSDTSEIKRVSKHNPYSDAGVVFDDKHRTDLQHLTEFLESFYSLKNTYFFEASNTFGTTFTTDMKYILHTEYNVNYVSMNIFVDDELKKFISYMPKFLEFCPDEINDIRLYNMGMASVTVNPDNTPKKFDFFISKENFCKLNYSCENKEEIQALINHCCFNSIIKIGFYFVGQEQYKWSLTMGINNDEEISNELNIHPELKQKIENNKESTFVYEMIWNNEQLEEKNILYYGA